MDFLFRVSQESSDVTSRRGNLYLTVFCSHSAGTMAFQQCCATFAVKCNKKRKKTRNNRRTFQRRYELCHYVLWLQADFMYEKRIKRKIHCVCTVSLNVFQAPFLALSSSCSEKDRVSAAGVWSVRSIVSSD